LPSAAVISGLLALVAPGLLDRTTGVADFALVAAGGALVASGFNLPEEDVAEGSLAVAAATAVLALPPVAVLAPLASLLATAGAFDAAFAVAVEGFVVVFDEDLAPAVVLGVDPCERAREVFAADLLDFASFFEDAILIAPWAA